MHRSGPQDGWDHPTGSSSNGCLCSPEKLQQVLLIYKIYHLMLNIPIALGTWDFVYVTDVRCKFSQKYKKEEHFFFFSKTVMIQNWFIWSGSFCRAGPSHWGPAGWMVCRWSVSHSPWSKCLLSHLSLLKQKVDKFQCLFKCHLWLLKWCNRRWMDLNVF